MTAFVALLRAVNVGGTGKLPMRELVDICKAAGFATVESYIASGNTVFSSNESEGQVKAKLEKALQDYAGKPVGVLLRTAVEMADVLAANPFPNAAPSRTVAIFLDTAPPAHALETLKGQKDEAVRLGTREIYVHYVSGLGTSKLRIPAAKAGTARNMNMIAKLVEMTAAI